MEDIDKTFNILKSIPFLEMEYLLLKKDCLDVDISDDGKNFIWQLNQPIAYEEYGWTVEDLNNAFRYRPIYG